MLPLEVIAICYSVSGLPSDFWWNTRASKRGQKSQSVMSKLRETSRNPEVLSMGNGEDSRARPWPPTLVTGKTRKQSRHCPAASRSYWSTVPQNWKGPWCLWDLTVLRSCTFLPRAIMEKTKATRKEQPSWPSALSPHQAAQRRKWIDGSHVHFIYA